jgi:folate-binding protein YgfZ
MPLSLLPDRALLLVSGEEAEALLNRLFTRSMTGMEVGEARYSALLTPQGKLQFDFLVYRRADGFLLDAPARDAEALAKKLTMFKLRAKVTIAPQPDLAVAAAWGEAPDGAPGEAYRDPRHALLGTRLVAPREALAALPTDEPAYEAHRIALGVPKGGVDFVYGDTFVHDANLDLLHGVDFDKGCYVGQEVVSRVHHRNSARKRIVKVHFEGPPPEVGAAMTAGPAQIGTLTSLAGADGLASVRLDRLAEAEAEHQPVRAGAAPVAVTPPAAHVEG